MVVKCLRAVALALPSKATVKETVRRCRSIYLEKHEVVHSYGWYLRKYVTDTQAKGAIPITLSLTLVTAGKTVESSDQPMTTPSGLSKQLNKKMLLSLI